MAQIDTIKLFFFLTGDFCATIGMQIFLNQAHASHRLALTWFLRIASVRECLYACVFVCVSAPKAINN